MNYQVEIREIAPAAVISVRFRGKYGLDFKKAYKDLYLPKQEPSLVEVSAINFFMVDGKGDPNTSQEYRDAVEILYGLSFTVKMSKMNGRQPDGYFEYVVPPLEGLWWFGNEAFDLTQLKDKSKFCWTSMLRQPDFVTPEVFSWAASELKQKKPGLPVGKARLETLKEGLCAQLLHVGPYDGEPASYRRLENFITENGYGDAVSAPLPSGQTGRHHEIYLSDPRRTAPEKMKTVLRHPVVKKNP